MANDNYYVNLVRKSIQAGEIACIPIEGLYTLTTGGEVVLLDRYFSEGKQRRLTESDLKPEELRCQAHHDTGMADTCSIRCIERILESETQERALGLAKEEAIKKSGIGANVVLYDYYRISKTEEGTTVTLECLACKYTLKEK